MTPPSPRAPRCCARKSLTLPGGCHLDSAHRALGRLQKDRMEVLKVQKWNHHAASGPSSGRLSSGDSSAISQRPLQPLVCRSAIPEAQRTPRGVGGEEVECAVDTAQPSGRRSCHLRLCGWTWGRPLMRRLRQRRACLWVGSKTAELIKRARLEAARGGGQGWDDWVKVVRRCRLCYKISGGVGMGEAPPPLPVPLRGCRCLALGGVLGSGAAGRAVGVSGPCGTVGPGMRVTLRSCCVPVRVVTHGYMCSDVMRPHRRAVSGMSREWRAQDASQDSPCARVGAPAGGTLILSGFCSHEEGGLGGWVGVQEQVPVCLEWMPESVTTGIFHQGPRLLGRGSREAWGTIFLPPSSLCGDRLPIVDRGVLVAPASLCCALLAAREEVLASERSPDPLAHQTVQGERAR